jgi:hypothetical protein
MGVVVSYSFEEELGKRVQRERSIDMLDPDAIRKYITFCLLKDLDGVKK